MDDFLEFFFGDDFDFEFITIAESPASPLAQPVHPLLEALRAAIERLVTDMTHRLGEGVAVDCDASIDLAEFMHRPLDGDIADIGHRWVTTGAGEQLSLFDPVELAEFNVGDVPIGGAEAVLGALLLDKFDPREGWLGSEQFNRVLETGCKPQQLHDEVLRLARLLHASAVTAGVNLLDHFRQLSLIIRMSS
jgi:hypothetical protein